MSALPRSPKRCRVRAEPVTSSSSAPLCRTGDCGNGLPGESDLRCTSAKYQHRRGKLALTTPTQPPNAPRDWTDSPSAHPYDAGPSYPQYPSIPFQQTAPPAGLEGPLAPLTTQSPAKGTPWLRITFIVGGALIALAVVIGVAVGSGDPKPAAATPTAPIPAVPAPQATHTPAQALYAWYKNGGESHIDALTRDFQSAGEGGLNQDVAGMAVACSALQRDVEAAQAYDPIPDAEAQRHFAAALAQHARAATDCLAGISGMNGGLIAKATRELTAGTTEMGKATARIREIRGN